MEISTNDPQLKYGNLNPIEEDTSVIFNVNLDLCINITRNFRSC
jgi:hypothetical protein